MCVLRAIQVHSCLTHIIILQSVYIGKIKKNSIRKNKYNIYFLHSPLCKAEGLCQHPVIKLREEREMINGPIRVKQVNQSSAVIGHIDELASTTDESLAGRPPSRHVRRPPGLVFICNG